jgi:hypothetical protein
MVGRFCCLRRLRTAWQEVLVDNSPISLAVWDADLRCVWANRTENHARGAVRHRREGVRLRAVPRDFEVNTIEAILRQVLSDGYPAVDHEFRKCPRMTARGV